MGHAALTDGGTANGVFLASLDHFVTESATPVGQGAGCLMLARFRRMTPLACYFPQLKAKAAFFDRCLELAASIRLLHLSSRATSTPATNSPTEAKEQEKTIAPITSTSSHQRVDCWIFGGSRMARAASGPGIPPKAMAFGSTTLLAMAHSLR